MSPTALFCSDVTAVKCHDILVNISNIPIWTIELELHTAYTVFTELAS